MDSSFTENKKGEFNLESLEKRELHDEVHDTILEKEKECDVQNEQNCSTKVKKLPRSVKKKLKREEKVANIRKMRKEKKMMKKQSHCSNSDKPSPSSENLAKRERETSDISSIGHISKKVRLLESKQRCKEAMTNGQKVCIDCGLKEHMTEKQCSKLAQQIGRLYGSNRKSQKPAHIYLTNLSRQNLLFKECCQKNSGFENYMVDMTEESQEELFNIEDIIYLSPDSENVLNEIDPKKVYVIGGIIDETVKNNVTLTKAKELKVQSARLPIDKYMEKSKGIFSHKKILSVNQVFDILLSVSETGDWRKALEEHVPKRTGFVLKKCEIDVKI